MLYNILKKREMVDIRVSKRRVERFLVMILCATIFLSGCNISGGNAEYRKAIKGLKNTEVTEEGAYAVTEELIIASQNVEFTEPKNIIYMIGDGMGINIVETTRDYYEDKLYNGALAIDYVPQVGWHSSYSADAQVTDSAAGGTALATGYKTSNRTLAMDKLDKSDYKTLLELASEKGMSTGVVATKAVTDATPASFTTHVADHDFQIEIAAQQIEKLTDGTLDLLLGGGRKYYSDESNADTLSEAINQGVTCTTMWDGTEEKELPLVGLYAENHLNTYDAETPTIAEMTDLALEKLSEDKNGFFLMVEGSQIDSEAHDNSYYNEMKEMYDFDCAIGVALKFVVMHPDTVLIITADHETGGLHLPMESAKQSTFKYYYASTDHTSIQVPVYAIGYGVEKLSGIRENTDIAAFVASLMGEDEFGEKSKTYSLFSKEEGEQLTIDIDETNYRWDLPKDMLLEELATAKNVRAVHINTKNVSGGEVHLPALMIRGESIDISVAPQVDYLEAGEEMMLTYVLPKTCWKDNAFASITEMSLSYELCDVVKWKTYQLESNFESASFEISEIWVTERDLEY